MFKTLFRLLLSIAAIFAALLGLSYFQNKKNPKYIDIYSDIDEDDDDEFPSELAPRSSSGVSGGSFSDFGFVGGGRRERNDDGYGSFETDDDDDNGGYNYRSDRRRYR